MSREGAERALREAVDRLEQAGAGLRARSPESIADALAEAWARLADPERALGRAARERLPESTGLSLAGVAWALSSCLAELDAAALRGLAARMAPPPGAVAAPARLSVLVLAGNVFTAAVAPCTLALLARAPVLVKASSRDDVLPRLFRDALFEVDATLADACTVVSFPGGEPTLEAAALERADVVSAFGSDRTIAALRARLAPTTELVTHGHGLGVGFVPRATLASPERIRDAAEGFALDVGAYDQRGCLSPHAIVTEGDGAALAEALAEALRALEVRMPRGALPAEVGAAQLQWRGVAAARGTLREGDGWAVAHEGGAPLRLSPGYRNVTVIEAEDRARFVAGLSRLGAHLKCVGVAADEATRREVAGALPPGLAPRVCRAGAMQRPSLGTLADGRLPWEGLLRFRAVE